MYKQSNLNSARMSLKSRVLMDLFLPVVSQTLDASSEITARILPLLYTSVRECVLAYVLACERLRVCASDRQGQP